MTTNLPTGIVTTTDTVAHEIQTIDHVDVDDIARLWKVYSTNRNLLPHHAGRRLENIFWRIWSSPGIYQKISGAAVARLFMFIFDDRGILRTTPVQSPRSRHPRDGFRSIPAPSRLKPTVAIKQPAPAVEAVEASSSKGPPSSSSPERVRSGPLPPILKNASSYRESSSSSSQMARSMQRTASNESGSSSERKISFNPPRPPTPPLSHRQPPADQLAPNQARNSQGKRKKTTTFAAGSGAGRRRPIATRRKSSQSSAGTSSSARSGSPFRSNPQDGTTETLRDDDLEASIDPKEPTPELTSGQDQAQEASEAPLKPRDDAHADGPPPPVRKDWVVDHDFRARSVADRRSHTDLTSMATNNAPRQRFQKTAPTLAATTTGAVGQFGDWDLPLQKGKGKSKANESRHQQPQNQNPVIVDRVEPLKQEGPSESTTTSARRPPSDSGTKLEPLQRTKSQLTLLLQRDRLQHQSPSTPGVTTEDKVGGKKGRTSSSS